MWFFFFFVVHLNQFKQQSRDHQNSSSFFNGQIDFYFYFQESELAICFFTSRFGIGIAEIRTISPPTFLLYSTTSLAALQNLQPCFLPLSTPLCLQSNSSHRLISWLSSVLSTFSVPLSSSFSVTAPWGVISSAWTTELSPTISHRRPKSPPSSGTKPPLTKSKSSMQTQKSSAHSLTPASGLQSRSQTAIF